MEQPETEESFLTVAEVAETLKLNQQTVRNWIDQGSLPAVRVGRRVRIKRSDFDRILEENYSGRTSPSTEEAPEPAGDSTLTGTDFWGGEPVGIPEPVTGTAAASEPGASQDPDGPAGAGNPLAAGGPAHAALPPSQTRNGTG